jgi:hypothetical protein
VLSRPRRPLCVASAQALQHRPEKKKLGEAEAGWPTWPSRATWVELAIPY